MLSNRMPFIHAQHSILIVEDDREIAEQIGRAALEYFDMPAVLARTLFEASAVLDQYSPRVVLVDMLLPDGDGSELLARLDRQQVPAVAVMTAAPSLYRATVALRSRAADFLVKPFRADQLQALFARLARRLSDADDLDRLRQRAEQAEQTNEKLRQKIDILCKDLVGGYQQLVTRMVRTDTP